MSYLRIPHSEYFVGDYPPEWEKMIKIAQSTCQRCKQPIGYDKLIRTLAEGYEHVGRCPEKTRTNE